MKFSESLKKNKDFQVVYRRGKSYGNRYLVMYVLKNDLGKNRVGISVSKKVGNSIVRHHLTRLIRESYRLHEDMFQCGYDFVIIARVSAKEKSYREIESALIHLGKLHNIVCVKQDICKNEQQKGEPGPDHAGSAYQEDGCAKGTERWKIEEIITIFNSFLQKIFVSIKDKISLYLCSNLFRICVGGNWKIWSA